ncbi:MAG TPA: hypothetical protein VLT87_09865 [Thermoanaerobaculia bacterium]|nr:hypothetical protein [Thermoanaerobaculia bacterium]
MTTRSIQLALCAAALLALLAAPARSAEPADGRTAPLLEGMGKHHHAVTTKSPLAQRYFDQGLTLAYAFNHAEAARSFREAARLDSECAMCWWGVALVQGPNINAKMEEAAVAEAWDALRKAQALAAKAGEKERAWVEALSARYSDSPTADRAALDSAYADAMRRLAWRYPEDSDAATLFAEALMDTMPWAYWEKDGQPKPATREVLAVLEGVLARDPNHPGANHFYIHAVEAVRPELGIAAAERLGSLVPAAGHLVHMPSHIYIRVGRYHDASVANQRAMEADKSYVTQCHAQGLYPLVYMPHNHHFLWAAATLEGRSALALEAARDMASGIDHHAMRQDGLGTLQHYQITPLYALVRFGRWDEILKTPEPDADLVYPRAVWHYARGMAFARTGRPDEADREREKVRALAAEPAMAKMTVWDINTVSDLLKVADALLAGETAAARRDWDAAVRHLEAAVTAEDALNYDEPPPWHFPSRQILGAVLLEAGRPADAERVYQEDLRKFPENGWSLNGLRQSLAVQGKAEEAAKAEARFREAWKHADVTLAASRF